MNSFKRFCLSNFLFYLLLAGTLVFFYFCYFSSSKTDSTNTQALSSFPTFSGKTFLSGKFQDQLEQALKDQLSIHSQAVSFTGKLKSGIGKRFAQLDNLIQGKGINEGLLPYGNVFEINGSQWLTNLPYTNYSADIEGYQRKAAEINELSEKWSAIRFYVYYCSRTEDLDWFDDSEGIKSYRYADLLHNSLNETISFDQLKHHDFSDVKDHMYKTDHHWNNIGARVGYADVLRMMNEDFNLGNPRPVLYSTDFNGLKWQGSRARESGLSIPSERSDSFIIDIYDLPPHRTWFGNQEQEIGLASAYEAGEINRGLSFDQYLNYYGFESQKITIRYDSGKENLLIIGDSFARAIREQLASHFQTTVYINFRVLENYHIDDVIKENQISAVLFIGQQDAWSGYFLTGDEK